MQQLRLISAALLVIFFTLATQGCGKKSKSSGKSANLPLVTPPVTAATPASLRTGASLDLSLPVGEFKSRFFNAAGGPSNIFNILSGIDDRINGINSQTSGTLSACVSQTPVAYTINFVGTDVKFYAQCYETVSVPPGSAANAELIQFGVKDGVTYIFTAIGAGNTAVIATPVAGAAGKFNIQAWLSVGFGNMPQFDSMSYGLMELAANSATTSFEFTVAGIGLGYCGAQLKSNGTDIYATGSADGGATCQAVDSLCVQANDATTAGTCGTEVMAFALAPIGRLATKGANSDGASLYPATPNVALDGTASDAVHFGPTTPTSGVGALATGKN